MFRIHRKAKALQIRLSELFDGSPTTKSTDYLPTIAGQNGSPEEKAVTARDLLAVGIAEQFGWRNVEIAFNRWREVLERRGIYVFKDAFRNDALSVFVSLTKRSPSSM